MQLSWNKDKMTPPLVVLTAEDDTLDPVTVRHWKEEGFQIFCLPFKGRRKEYIREIDHLPDPLELGEKYAIVGRSRTLALDVAMLISAAPQHTVKRLP